MRVQELWTRAVAVAREAAWRLTGARVPRGSPLDGHISRRQTLWRAARSPDLNAMGPHWKLYFKPPGGELHTTRFLERAELYRMSAGWSLSPDDALDERHPLVAMAFAYRMRDLSCQEEEAVDRLTRAIAENIVNRLSGRRSEAPAEEWFEGFWEDTAGFEELRKQAMILREAREIEAGLSKARSSQGSADRSWL